MAMKAKRQMKVTEATYKRNLKKYATEGQALGQRLMKFIEAHKLSDKVSDDLCGIIDDYVLLGSNMAKFCAKNDVPESRWREDFLNMV